MRIRSPLRQLLILAGCVLAFGSPVWADIGIDIDVRGPQTLLPTMRLPGPAPAPVPLVVRPAGKPEIRSALALIIDETDASILYAQRADDVVPIASITKLMTALVVLEAGQSLDEVVAITADDRDTELGTGSRLVIGARLTRRELLHLALMASENRAAHALGRTYPGGLPAFLRAMNAKAKALGMTSTRFTDPTGLSSRNVASARDLVKLVAATAVDPMIRSFSTDENLSVAVNRGPLEFRNTNTLVTDPDWEISLQKTGYTRAAGRCLVMRTLIQDRPVVIVLLNAVGTRTRLADVRRIRQWMESAVGEQLARNLP